ncbi:MAG TPA: hypothetical protein VH158_00265 [Gemmatimonadales bacterium]|jgi:plastocyanin|nr:hypothetical protein [Gemmatimonadales bacterium]
MKAAGYVIGAALVAAGYACRNAPMGGGNTCAGVVAQQVINATDNQTFVPASVTVTAGQTVCWQNQGTLTHSVTHDTIDVALPPNYVYVETMGKAGVNLSYHCRYHSSMTGLIAVR